LVLVMRTSRPQSACHTYCLYVNLSMSINSIQTVCMLTRLTHQEDPMPRTELSHGVVLHDYES